jgi:hypothetical protein
MKRSIIKWVLGGVLFLLFSMNYAVAEVYWWYPYANSTKDTLVVLPGEFTIKWDE